jgi:hypothetical protein
VNGEYELTRDDRKTSYFALPNQKRNEGDDANDQRGQHGDGSPGISHTSPNDAELNMQPRMRKS